jgi:hypothetical protein
MEVEERSAQMGEGPTVDIELQERSMQVVEAPTVHLFDTAHGEDLTDCSIRIDEVSTVRLLDPAHGEDLTDTVQPSPEPAVHEPISVMHAQYGTIEVPDVESQESRRRRAGKDMCCKVCQYLGIVFLLGICYCVGWVLYMMYLIQKCGIWNERC